LTIYAIKGSGYVKRLKGTHGCRLRIGDWRVIFIEDAKSITVIAVGIQCGVAVSTQTGQSEAIHSPEACARTV